MRTTSFPGYYRNLLVNAEIMYIVVPGRKDDEMNQFLEVTKEIVIALIQHDNLALKPSHAAPAEERNDFALEQLNKAITSIYQSVSNSTK